MNIQVEFFIRFCSSRILNKEDTIYKSVFQDWILTWDTSNMSIYLPLFAKLDAPSQAKVCFVVCHQGRSQKELLLLVLRYQVAERICKLK